MADFENFSELTAQYNSTLPTLTDGDASALQVDSSGRLLIAGNFDVNLDAAGGDNVAISDGTDTLAVNGDGSINVVASATDLDIRDLSHTQDSIRIGDGTDLANVTASGELNVLESNSGSILTSLQLIDNAVFAVDTAAGATDGGYNILAVRDDALTALTPVDGDYVSLRVNSDGALWVQHDGDVTIADGGNVITVDAVDLDIRDLSASQDNIAISDGTDTLAVNADGSINVQFTLGTESDASSDPSGDGLVALTAGPDVLVSISVGAGTTYKCHGWSWASDRQCGFKLEVYDGASLVEVLRATINSGSMPGDSMNFGVPIEIAGAATRVIRVSATRLTGTNGLASAAINGTLD